MDIVFEIGRVMHSRLSKRMKDINSVQVLRTEVSLPREGKCISISSFNLGCFNCWMQYCIGTVSEVLST